MSDEPLIAPVYVPCETCGSEGRILVQAPTYWEPYNERDDGPCPACDGTGVEMIEDCETAGEPDASGYALAAVKADAAPPASASPISADEQAARIAALADARRREGEDAERVEGGTADG